MAKVLDRPTETARMLENYRQVCDLFPDLRVELVDDRIVVSDVPTLDHNKVVSRLLRQIMSLAIEHDWDILTNIKLFLNVQEERYIPDLAVVPPSPRMWGTDEVYAASTVLAVEVVSPSSVNDDYVIKPGNYARGGVPLYLLIDPAKGIARLYTQPTEKGYRQRNEVPLGDPLELPKPWDLTIDTGKLIDP